MSVLSTGTGPVLVRPDWAGLGGNRPGKVAAVRFAGPHTDYQLTTPDGDLLIRESGPPRLGVGDTTTWTLHGAHPLTP